MLLSSKSGVLAWRTYSLLFDQLCACRTFTLQDVLQSLVAHLLPLEVLKVLQVVHCIQLTACRWHLGHNHGLCRLMSAPTDRPCLSGGCASSMAENDAQIFGSRGKGESCCQWF